MLRQRQIGGGVLEHAGGAAVNPDEAMVAISRADADLVVGRLKGTSLPYLHEVAHRIEAAVMRADDAHRASGEGGSTSALRASAPEGNDAPDLRGALADLGRTAHRWRKALQQIAGSDEVLFGDAMTEHRQAIAVARAALADHTPASVEAGPSRGADAPLAPEGVDAEPSDADYDRFWNTVQGCARTASGIDAALCAFWRREPGYDFTEGDRTRMAGAVVAYLRAASVEAGPSRGAVAPLAPEGISDAMVARAVEAWHTLPPMLLDDQMRAILRAALAAPPTPEGLRADPGIDAGLLSAIAGDVQFAAVVSKYLANDCTIGALIRATLRAAARAGYVPGVLDHRASGEDGSTSGLRPSAPEAGGG